MTSGPRRIAIAAVAIALIAAACGGSDPGDDSPSTIAEPEASPTQTLEDGNEADTADHHTRYDADIADAEQTISVEVAGGAPVGGHQRVEVDLGSLVAVTVTADTAEEVHVHGYDILRAVSDGHPAHFAFTAEIPGVFEVELEGSGRLLLQLEIS